jgi:hypothetical protein
MGRTKFLKKRAKKGRKQGKRQKGKGKKKRIQDLSIYD